MERHLFVITRDPTSHPSAIYTLRLALGLQRRQHEVSVVFTDDALDALATRDGGPFVASLVSAGARLLVTADDTAAVELDSLGFERVSQDALAALLTTPGVTAQWC